MGMVIVYLSFRRCVLKESWLPDFEAESFDPQLGEFKAARGEGRIIVELEREKEETWQLHFTSNSKVYVIGNVLIFDSSQCKENETLQLDSFTL